MALKVKCVVGNSAVRFEEDTVEVLLAVCKLYLEMISFIEQKLHAAILFVHFQSPFFQTFPNIVQRFSELSGCINGVKGIR